MFSSYLHLEGPKGSIAYRGDTKGEVIGVGDIPISQNYSITNVLHIDTLSIIGFTT
jgi:cytoskeletal protein CcmA (bactofilin family)